MNKDMIKFWMEPWKFQVILQKILTMRMTTSQVHHLMTANKRGHRDLILATKDMSLTMVGNSKTCALPKGDL